MQTSDPEATLDEELEVIVLRVDVVLRISRFGIRSTLVGRIVLLPKQTQRRSLEDREVVRVAGLGGNTEQMRTIDHTNENRPQIRGEVVDGNWLEMLTHVDHPRCLIQ